MASDFYVLLFSMYSLSVSLFFSVYINNSVFDILGVVFINYCPIESQSQQLIMTKCCSDVSCGLSLETCLCFGYPRC